MKCRRSHFIALPRKFFLAGLLLLGVFTGLAGERELLRDPGFRDGFRVITPPAGQRVEVGQPADE